MASRVDLLVPWVQVRLRTSNFVRSFIAGRVGLLCPSKLAHIRLWTLLVSSHEQSRVNDGSCLTTARPTMITSETGWQNVKARASNSIEPVVVTSLHITCDNQPSNI